jgi:uncharacterized protein (DUF433 family)
MFPMKPGAFCELALSRRARPLQRYGWRILEARSEPVTAVFATQIVLDNQGVAWIGGTKTKVTEVVLDKIAYGWSPEEIHFQHPHLSLAQIHGALTYYYENQPDLDAQIMHRLEEAGKLAIQASDPDFRRKLAGLRPSL